MQLDGKVVVITGAGSGIGRALAVSLATAGCRLVLVGRQVVALEQTAAAIGSDKVLIVAADIAKAEDRQRLLQQVEGGYGRLDILVNNAGMVAVGALADMTDGAIGAMVTTNLLAPMLLVRAFLPLLQLSGPGSRIVNVGSVFGDIAYPLFAAYSATKFGLRGFSDAMRRELRRQGIGVTYIAPRATKTPASAEFSALIEPFAMTMDSAETVAGQIRLAIARDARTSYARGFERAFVLIQRLVPRLIDRAVSRQLAAARMKTAGGTGG